MKKSILINFYQGVSGLILLIIFLLFAAQCFAGSQTTSSTLASAIVDQARKYLNDPSAYGGTQYSIWSDAEMLQWVNDGSLDIVARTHCLEDVETERLIEDQISYPLSDPFIVIKHVIYNNDYTLKKGTIDEIGRTGSEDRGKGTGETLKPTDWAQWENNVLIYPVPDSTTVAEGTEKVTDGDFTESTDWTWGAGWAHDGDDDEADATASSADLEQDISSVPGETYLLAWTLKNDAGGSVLPILGGTNGTSKDANGTYSEYILATDSTNLKFDATAFTGSVDDVSVKRVANIAVYVIDRPTAVAADENVLLPAQYDKALVYFVVAQAFAKEGRLNTAAAFLTLYQQELDRFRMDLNIQPKEKESE